MEELALRLVDERKMSRNSSPTPSPLGLRLQLLGTGVDVVEGVMVPDKLKGNVLVLPTALRLQLAAEGSESLVWRRLLMTSMRWPCLSPLRWTDVYPIWYDPDVASATTEVYFVSFA